MEGYVRVYTGGGEEVGFLKIFYIEKGCSRGIEVDWKGCAGGTEVRGPQGSAGT